MKMEQTFCSISRKNKAKTISKLLLIDPATLSESHLALFFTNPKSTRVSGCRLYWFSPINDV